MESTSLSLLEKLRLPQAEDSWKRFAQLYTPVLMAWATRAGLQTSDAADLIQEVFVILVKKMPEFEYDHGKSFRAWLRTITMNKLRDWKRKEALAAEVPLHDDQLREMLTKSDSFWEIEFRKELAARALELLKAEFDANTWQACWEFMTQGTPAAQLAKRFGLSENAIYIAKCRMLKYLRHNLNGFLD